MTARKSKTTKSVDWRKIELATDEAGAALKLSGERIRQLTKAGYIRKAARGRYRLGDVIAGYVKFRDDAERRAAPSSERSRLDAARARQVELRVAEAENELVPIEAVDEAHAEIIGAFRAELSGVAAQATRDLVVRQQVEAALESAIVRCRERLEGFAAGRDPLADAED